MRYDIKADGMHLFISEEIYSPENYIQRYHNPMIAALRNELINRKIKKRDLIPLPYPDGYTHPDWFQEILTKKGLS